jgi:integrase
VLALLDAITPCYRVAVALGVGLGLREGEAFDLTVPRVDFLRRKIQVLSQAQRGQLAVDLKTEASTRTIPADEWVLNEISAHVASTLIAANLNPKVIQARLGHATITETLATYGHLFPDSEDLGRGAIDAIFAVALTEQERNQETR